MAKRKVVGAEAEVEEPKETKTSTKRTAKPAATSPKAKKAKTASNTVVSTPAKKAPAKKAASKTVNNNVAEPTENGVKPKSRSKKETHDAPVPVKAVVPAKAAAPAKKAAAKTVAKETTTTKTVKTPKPKPSPVKNKKAPAAAKAVPKVATPEKKTAAAKPKKRNTGQEEAAAKTQQDAVAGPSQPTKATTKANEAADGRKRAKAAKEVVAAKKPKLELIVPFRQTRGVGVVLTMGQGETGQLGLGPDVEERKRPTLVKSLVDVVDVVAGGMHTVCLTAQGEVFTFGCNDEGALGRETEQEEGSETEPGRVHLPGKVKIISAGDSHTAALLEDGRVFIWGNFRDSHGPMGLTSSGIQRTPVPIMEGIPVIQIASGADHFVCLTTEGQVYTCGCAEQGQLGRVAELFSNRGGRKGKDYLLTPQPVSLSKGGQKPIIVDSIWTGSYATFVRARDSDLIYVFGLNNYNQLGLPTVNTRFHPEVSAGFKGHKWQSISCGQHHTVALDAEGKVYCLGRKEYGRLGMGEINQDLVVPTPIPVLEATKCIEVAAGEAVTFALTENGTAYSWGMASNNQLGHGNEDEDALEPRVVEGAQLQQKLVLTASSGGQHTVLLATDRNNPGDNNAAASQ